MLTYDFYDGIIMIITQERLVTNIPEKMHIVFQRDNPIEIFIV